MIETHDITNRKDQPKYTIRYPRTARRGATPIGFEDFLKEHPDGVSEKKLLKRFPPIGHKDHKPYTIDTYDALRRFNIEQSYKNGKYYFRLYTVKATLTKDSVWLPMTRIK